ncbi:MAG: hypothetical protein WKG01_27295 [Kofleriaceae bacterium]
MREIVVVIVAAACTANNPGPTTPSPTAIETVEVTSLRRPRAVMYGRTDDTGRFLRILEIPLVESTTFGWRMDLGCTGPVLYRETMRLPAPGDWTFTPDELPETTISDGKRTATTRDYVACRAGWIEHTWRVSTGDPPGQWIVTVEIEGFEPTVWKPMFVKR